MDGIFDINKASKEDVKRVVEGMLHAKEEWLKMVLDREKELGIS